MEASLTSSEVEELLSIRQNREGKAMSAVLEHVNLTVRDAEAVAEVLGRLFGWHVRWQGTAMGDAHSVHVGTDDFYVALHAPARAPAPAEGGRYGTQGALNHIGVVVDDLEAAEARVMTEGFRPHSHADYEPGRRFYFDGPEGVEFEVVSYS
jgi:catechol 2,3-dioxygenase-like lactoylglutathione lyase family enzyme